MAHFSGSRKRAQKTTPSQYKMIVDAVVKNPVLMKTNQPSAEQPWFDLSHQLNSLRGGAQKSVPKWKRLLIEYKSKLRARAFRLQNASSNDRMLMRPLSEVDKKFLKFLGCMTAGGQIIATNNHKKSAIKSPSWSDSDEGWTIENAAGRDNQYMGMPNTADHAVNDPTEYNTTGIQTRVKTENEDENILTQSDDYNTSYNIYGLEENIEQPNDTMDDFPLEENVQSSRQNSLGEICSHLINLAESNRQLAQSTKAIANAMERQAATLEKLAHSLSNRNY